MPTFSECLMKARNDGQVTPDEADELQRMFNSFERQYSLDLGLDQADQAARKAVSDRLMAQAAETRRRAVIGNAVAERINADLKGHTNAKGETDTVEAVLSHIERKGWSKYSSVDGKADAILGMVHSGMESLLFNFERKGLTGQTKNTAQLKNVVSELFDEGTGDGKAKGMAQTWKKVANDLRERFNRAGGNIGELESWGLPQFHDPSMLVKMGMDKWKAYITPLLDRDKMLHPSTGHRLTDSELSDSLDYSFETITTEGWAHKDPKRVSQGKSSLARRHSDHRFLHFKDADSWMQYAKDYGGAAGWGREDVAWHAMMSHIRSMTKDIAAMEVLGPNPPAMLEWMKQLVKNQEAKTGQNTAKANRLTKQNGTLDTLWDAYNGAMDTPHHEGWAQGMATVRNLEIGSKLGGAALTALSDPGFQAATRMMAGADRSGLHSVVGDIVSQFSKGNRQEAVRAGLTLESASHMLHQETRYFGSLAGPQWSRYIADRVLTLSGLLPMTQASKHAWGLNFFGTMANHAGKTFDELGDMKFGGFDMKTTLERYGLTAFDWDVMRRVRLHEPKRGATYMRPRDIARLEHPEASRIAERYLEMVRDMGRMATPEGTLGTSAILKGNSQPGTVTGETMRAIAMFKSFPVSVAMLYGGHLQRELSAGQKARGAVYIGGTLLATTAMAAVGLQLSELSKGRDPRNMNDRKFWGAAMMKGGGLSLMGDFMYADHNRFGGGFFKSLGGPVIDSADKLAGLTLGNAWELASGKETHFGKEAVSFLKREMPGGSLWYARAAWERIFLDQLQSAVDPDAHKAFKRQQKYYRKNFEQDYFFEPGEATPDRLPDISKAWQ